MTEPSTTTQTRERRPQLVHTARQMFETRLAKYNDPHNLEWDFDDITDKWERHAWSAFLDLQAAERKMARLREALVDSRKAIASLAPESLGKDPRGHTYWYELLAKIDAALQPMSEQEQK